MEPGVAPFLRVLLISWEQDTPKKQGSGRAGGAKYQMWERRGGQSQEIERWKAGYVDNQSQNAIGTCDVGEAGVVFTLISLFLERELGLALFFYLFCFYKCMILILVIEDYICPHIILIMQE